MRLSFQFWIWVGVQPCASPKMHYGVAQPATNTRMHPETAPNGLNRHRRTACCDPNRSKRPEMHHVRHKRPRPKPAQSSQRTELPRCSRNAHPNRSKRPRRAPPKQALQRPEMSPNAFQTVPNGPDRYQRNICNYPKCSEMHRNSFKMEPCRSQPPSMNFRICSD